MQISVIPITRLTRAVVKSRIKTNKKTKSPGKVPGFYISNEGNIDRGGKVCYTLYDNVKGIKRYEKIKPKAK